MALESPNSDGTKLHIKRYKCNRYYFREGDLLNDQGLQASGCKTFRTIYIDSKLSIALLE